MSNSKQQGASGKIEETLYGDEKGMPTYWGSAQHVTKLQPAVYWVSTAGHGGLMIGKALARKILSKAAIAVGASFGSFLCYEEDCAWAVAFVDSVKIQELFAMWDRQKGRAVYPVEKAMPTVKEYYQSYLDAVVKERA